MDGTAQFYGWSKGSNLLSKYIQWVYIPAVKDAATEQEESNKTALGQLLEQTIRSKVNFKESLADLKKRTENEYQGILAEEATTLTELEVSIQTRLQSWANPGAALKLNWHFDANRSIVVSEPMARAQIGEDKFLGEVARLGHGMQRSFLVSVLHELASLNAEAGPTLVLGFEEPELYQHPPQAQHMASVLESMATSEAANAQVIVSTHSPHFVSTRGFENVRLVRKHRQDHCSLVSHTTFQDLEGALAKALCEAPQPHTVLMAKIEQIMQPSQRELYFSRIAILVEGLEDIAFVATHLQLRGQYDEFRQLGCHFIVCGGKTSLSRPLAIANDLSIPAFVIFDGDSDDPANAIAHTRDNGCLLRLCNVDQFDPIPTETLWAENVVMWDTDIMSVVKNDFADCWDQVVQGVRDTMGFPGGQKGIRQKNNLLIAATLESLASLERFSPALDRLCESILEFARELNVDSLDVSAPSSTAPARA